MNTGNKQVGEVIVMLHNIRSVHNVGAILRTAEAVGASAVYMTGYTPTPKDRFGRPRSDMAKASLGAEHMVRWKSRATLAPLLSKLKNEGWTIVGVEQSAHSLDYRSFRAPAKTVFIFGNEVKGLSKKIMDACDAVLEIPMYGRKESLNVSVTAGIILFSARHS